MKDAKDLGFPLYACSREITKRYNQAFSDLDLTYTQYLVLRALRHSESGTLKEIGDVLLLDSGTLTPLCKKLSGRGLITRERSGEDERNLIVTITEKGKALFEEAEKALENADFNTRLTEDQLTRLAGLTNALLSDLENRRKP